MAKRSHLESRSTGGDARSPRQKSDGSRYAALRQLLGAIDSSKSLTSAPWLALCGCLGELNLRSCSSLLQGLERTRRKRVRMLGLFS